MRIEGRNSFGRSPEPNFPKKITANFLLEGYRKMSSWSYQTSPKAQEELANIFYGKESYLNLIQKLTLFYRNFGKYYEIDPRDRLAFCQDNFDNLILNSNISASLEDMGVEPAEFCFHQGFIRSIFPLFVETLEEPILGWHQRYTNSAVLVHVTAQTNTSTTSYTLPISAAASTDMEIVENTQHQSNQPEMVQSPNVNFSQTPITPPPTPHGKKKSVSYAEILATPAPNRADSPSPEEISGKMDLDSPPSSSTSFKNKNDAKPTKTSKKKDRNRVVTNTRILTGH
jgi:hypothetical protein